MLEFSDAPYRFFEGKPSAPIIWLARQANRFWVLGAPHHQIAEVRVEGAREAVADARASGARLLFVVNHPSHSDPQVVTEVHRQLGVDSCFMAAYDVFLRSEKAAWVMQRLGNFSIDREGSDRRAMSAAIDTLKSGRQALTIFPEGNVYLTNDRVTPFLDGTAFIAIKAQAALKEIPLKIVPLSLKFTHLTTPRDSVTRRMIQLGTDSGYVFPEGSTQRPVDAVLGLGQHIVHSYLESHGFERATLSPDATVYETLTRFAHHLVEELEGALGLAPKPDQILIDRIRKIRSTIHQLRTDEPGNTHPEIDGLADKAILAFRVNGHLTPYLTQHPTIDRYDETVERLAEDFYSRTMPRTGRRRAIVRVHPPIDVAERVASAGGKSRDAIAALTREMEEMVQAGIDAINETNDAPGGQLAQEGPSALSSPTAS